MRFTRLTVFLAVVAIPLFLAGCNGKREGGAPARDREIVFVFKVDGLLYGDACKRGAQQASDELDGVTVKYLAPDKADAGKQREIIEQLIAQKVAAIVISPNDAEAVRPIIEKATDAGIKVFT